MSKEEQLLECWHKLSTEAQEQVLQLAQSLKPQPEFVPQTERAQKAMGNTPTHCCIWRSSVE